MPPDSHSGESTPEDINAAPHDTSTSRPARRGTRMLPSEEAAETGTPPDIRKRLAALGWRQGALLPARTEISDALEIVPFAQQLLPADGRFWLIVASQDCDVVHGDLSVEPAVELLVAIPVERLDRSRTNLRHPRELQFEMVAADGRTQPVSVHVRGRAFIDRRELLSLEPDNSLRVPDNVVAQIAGLLADRYNRVALPDAFEARFKPAKQKLRRILDRYALELFDIYVHLTPTDEIHDQAEHYSLTVYAVVHDEIADGPTQAYAALRKELSSALRRIIHTCEGIDLDKVVVCGRDDITLRELEVLRQINFEGLSFELDGEKRSNEVPFKPDQQ